MLDKIFPSNLYEIIRTHLNFSKIYEIRIRSEKPIMINYAGKFYYLGLEGLTDDEDNAIICENKIVETIVLRASNHSIYSVNEDIKKGFITISGGIRIGICGDLVFENGIIKTIKNFSSLNLRFPHEVKNCSLKAFNYILNNSEILNTLIVSPPSSGKTTFIRDLCYQISSKNLPLNLLLLDERNEISATINGVNQMDIGKRTDVMLYSTKKIGFENGIRSMAPDVILTDELGNKEDLEAINYACFCGVKIIASTHAKDILDLKNKANFNEIINKKIFKRFIVLSSRNGPGTYEGIFDENFIRIF